MALKYISKLTPRNQSALVSELYKMINYYSEMFCPRDRTYIKKLSQEDGNIYWSENIEHKLIAAAIVDPNHTFVSYDIPILPFGHVVSKRISQTDSIMNHILSDYENNTLALICRPLVAASLNAEGMGMIGFSPLELHTHWQDLANHKTNYFNVTNEPLTAGMDRKEHYVYLKIAQSDLKKLETINPPLANFIKQKMGVV